jgi:hypothetical protein
MEETKQIIEIKGIKFEVDLRTATRIEEFRVGDGVKILKRGYSDWTSHVGVIVGFDNFTTHPTIIVAYLVADYSSARIEFAYINSEAKDIELCNINDWDIPYSKVDILDRMDKDIERKKEEIRDLISKKDYFEHMFGKYFENKVSTQTL